MAFDKLAWQRKRRAQTDYLDTKKYEKTRKGFLMRTYRNMKSRTGGVQKLKAHLYEGLDLLPKKEFYVWTLNDPTFDKLFVAWESTNYSRKLTPSINRKDPNLGYVLDNLEWITHSENSKLGALNRCKS